MTTSARAADGASSPSESDAPLAPQGAVLAALNDLMTPLATLAVARGVPYAAVEEGLKRAFVAAARAAQPDAAGSRLVSRISTATGLNRRDVTRLSQPEAPTEAARPSPATQLFTRWLADPALRTRQGQPRPLPRQGPAPSFEALARSITTDVHPRSLLDELCRLELARLAEDDSVHLLAERFVPRKEDGRMLGFLSHNVGDHLRAAIGNVLSPRPPHLEQAVFADELSQASVDEIGQAMRAHWKTLLSSTVTELNRLIDSDRDNARPQDQRVRVGLYMYTEPMPGAAPLRDAPAPPKPRARRVKKT